MISSPRFLFAHGQCGSHSAWPTGAGVTDMVARPSHQAPRRLVLRVSARCVSRDRLGLRQALRGL